MANDANHRPARSAGHRALPKSEATREKIIVAAAHVLVERGYAGTKLSDIGERVGMQAGSLYYHFEDRDDIVDHVLQRSIRGVYARVRTAVEALPDGTDDLTRLRTAITAHLTVILESSDVSSAGLRLLGQLPPEVQPRYRRDQRKYGDYWHRIIVTGQASGAIRDDIDPVRLRLLIIGQLNWVSEWPRSAIGSRDDVQREAMALIMGGVVPSAV
jgi:AcrR family transcriptional regulator